MLDKVRVFDNKGETFDRYTVIIGNAVFTMSDNPTSPQGVNMYCGELSEFDTRSFGTELTTMPSCITKAVEGRLP
jgi:hypothetical protein